MEEMLTKIIERIFNNWTALKLAVDNSFGGPDSLQTANELKTYMVEYCLQNDVEVEDIQDTLEDIMEQELMTTCEDNSTKEISIIIHRFLQLLKQQNFTQCEIEFNQLPDINENWLGKSHVQPSRCPIEDSSSDEAEDTMMEEESEWTVVKSRKKR